MLKKREWNQHVLVIKKGFRKKGFGETTKKATGGPTRGEKGLPTATTLDGSGSKKPCSKS